MQHLEEEKKSRKRALGSLGVEARDGKGDMFIRFSEMNKLKVIIILFQSTTRKKWTTKSSKLIM